jgi:hypothetical protein
MTGSAIVKISARTAPVGSADCAIFGIVDDGVETVVGQKLLRGTPVFLGLKTLRAGPGSSKLPSTLKCYALSGVAYTENQRDFRSLKCPEVVPNIPVLDLPRC